MFAESSHADLYAAVDELVGRRGLRTPFIRLAHEGTVLPPGASGTTRRIGFVG